jgi:hypothetical protein
MLRVTLEEINSDRDLLDWYQEHGYGFDCIMGARSFTSKLQTYWERHVSRREQPVATTAATAGRRAHDELMRDLALPAPSSNGSHDLEDEPAAKHHGMEQGEPKPPPQAPKPRKRFDAPLPPELRARLEAHDSRERARQLTQEGDPKA